MTYSPRYSADAVNNAIASSNRHGRHIGKREATAIHRLLAGRSISVARNDGTTVTYTSTGGYRAREERSK